MTWVIHGFSRAGDQTLKSARPFGDGGSLPRPGGPFRQLAHLRFRERGAVDAERQADAGRGDDGEKKHDDEAVPRSHQNRK